MLARQGHRLLQIGVALILFSSLEGFAIPYLAFERIGLSVHTLSALQGVFLLAQGLVWPRLALGAPASRVAFWCSVYATLAILAAYAVASAWGVGNETIRLMGALPHGLSHGTPTQEAFIRVLAYSFAPTGLIAFGTHAMGPSPSSGFLVGAGGLAHLGRPSTWAL
jgi:hydroxylaminobenzene mutase